MRTGVETGLVVAVEFDKPHQGSAQVLFCGGVVAGFQCATFVGEGQFEGRVCPCGGSKAWSAPTRSRAMTVAIRSRGRSPRQRRLKGVGTPALTALTPINGPLWTFSRCPSDRRKVDARFANRVRRHRELSSATHQGEIQ